MSEPVIDNALPEEEGVLEPGTIINGFRIERELGRGAMAIVYLATQLDLDRLVAFKVMSPELAADTEFVSRFVNEARAAAALNHPAIIQAYQVGEIDGQYFFCMEYVDGETLLQMLRRVGKIPVNKTLEWFLQIAEALQYGWDLHRFTHGDIKPENIMINSRGQAKLADFGLARVDGHDYSGQTIMLTPLYAPPELIRGEKFVDECRPDIYAFGASLYHALAGSPPFPGTEAKIVVQRQLNEPLEPLCHRNPEIPKPLSDLVGEMLVKEMQRRLGSWQEVIAGLQACQKGHAGKRLINVHDVRRAQEGSSMRSVLQQEREQGKRQMKTLALVGALVVAGFAGGAFVLLQGGKKTPAPAPAPVAPPAVVAQAPTPVATTEPASTPVAKPAPKKAKKAKKVVVAVKEEQPDVDKEQEQVKPAPATKEKDVLEDDLEPATAEEAEAPKAKAKTAVVDEEPAEGQLQLKKYRMPIELNDKQKVFLQREERLIQMLRGQQPPAPETLEDEALAKLLQPASRKAAQEENFAWKEWQELNRACEIGSVELIDRKLWNLMKHCSQTVLMQRLGTVVEALGEKNSKVSRYYEGRHLLGKLMTLPRLPKEPSERQEVLRQILWLDACFGGEIKGDRRKLFAKMKRQLGNDVVELEGLGNSIHETLTMTGKSLWREPLFSQTVVKKVMAKLKKNERLEEISERMEEQLSMLALLDMGSWNFIRERRKNLNWPKLEKLTFDKLPESGRRVAAETFAAKALLDWRYDDDAKAMRQASWKIHELVQGGWKDGDVALLALELELRLLSRYQDLGAEGMMPLVDEEYETQADELPRVLVRLRRRLVYLWLTVCLERGETEQARAFLEMLQDEGQAELFGFAGRGSHLTDGMQLLRNELDCLQVPKQLLDRALVGESLRFKMACLGEEPLDGLQEGAYRQLFEQELPKGRLTLGDAVFDWVLRRVAYDIRSGELGYAMETIEWALNQRAICMFPYLGRLLFLRTGVLLYHGLTGGIEDMQMLAQGATVLSKGERKLLEALAKGELLKEQGESDSAKRQTMSTWQAWLATCQWLGSKGTDEQLDTVRLHLANAAQGAPPAERCLIAGLKRHLDKRLKKEAENETSDSEHKEP